MEIEMKTAQIQLGDSSHSKSNKNDESFSKVSSQQEVELELKEADAVVTGHDML